MTQQNCDQFVNHQTKELKLLEHIRQCIQSKIKCQKEFSDNLLTISVNATKINNGQLNLNNYFENIWFLIGKEIKNLAKMFEKQSQLLNDDVLGVIDLLIEERKAIKKNYTQQLAKINGEESKLQSTLKKIKSEYISSLASYKMLKSKYETFSNNFTKNSVFAITTINKKAKSVTEMKRQLMKQTRKLHHTHNDYIFAIREANNYQMDMKMTLVPNLNKCTQNLLVEGRAKWRDSLRKMIDLIDFDNDRCQNLRDQIDQDIRGVLSDTLYTPFTESCEDINEYKFDESILRDYDGNLKCDELAVDTFTFDSLKNLEFDLQSQMIDYQREIKSFLRTLQFYQKEIGTIEALNKTNLTDSAKFRASVHRKQIDERRKDIELLKLQLIERECQYERAHKKWCLIGDRVSKLNEKTIPLGLRLDEATETVSVCSLPRPTDSHSDHSKTDSYQYSVSSLKNFLLSKLHLPPKTAPHVKKTVGRSKSAPKIRSPQQAQRRLEDETWFHGLLPREDVDRLLNREGDFLVRESYSKGDRRFVISVRWKGLKHFMIIETESGYFKLESLLFPTVTELIAYYNGNGIELSKNSPALLLYPIDRESWELDNDDIELDEIIGRGNFGDVHRAVLRVSSVKGFLYDKVAVKICKLNLPEEMKKKFLIEARILKQYNHPNVVKFIGICVKRQPIMIAMELVAGGSLLNHLRNVDIQRKITLKNLINMCLDTAMGMEYLESRRCIHRDLAARNCLIGDDKRIKISDFGMSREIIGGEYTVSQGLKMIPIKWTAPEAMNYGRYTHACDVWSYGILMWEIFSLGSTPYCGMSNTKTRELIDQDYRLPSPVNTPIAIYEQMRKCWLYEPSERPNFREIRETLENLRDQLVEKTAP